MRATLNWLIIFNPEDQTPWPIVSNCSVEFCLNIRIHSTDDHLSNRGFNVDARADSAFARLGHQKLPLIAMSCQQLPSTIFRRLTCDNSVAMNAHQGLRDSLLLDLEFVGNEYRFHAAVQKLE